jgi:AcrR family transcriptional regulator
MSTRDALLDATRRVISRSGFAATTVGEITREAGASLGLLHYHFGSKAEVVAETFAQIAREDLAELEAGAAGQADPVDRLAATIDLSGWSDAESWRLWIDAWGEAVHSEPMRVTLAGFAAGWRALLARVLADGARAGAWSCPDPDDTAGRLVATIDGIGLHAALHPDTVPPATAGAWARRAAETELGITLPVAPAPAAGEAPGFERELVLREGDRDAGGHLTPAACASLLGAGRTAWLGGARVVRLELEPRAVAAAGDAIIARYALTHRGATGARTRETLLGADGAVLATAACTLEAA